MTPASKRVTVRLSVLVTLILAIAPCVFASPSASTIAAFYVRTNGRDSGDGTSPQTAFRTVGRALDFASRRPTRIVIGPGTYSGSTRVEPTVNLIVVGDESGRLTGDAAGAVVLSPASPSTAALTIASAGASGSTITVRLEGITFDGPGQGIELSTGQNDLLSRCTFHGLSKGLSVLSASSLTVQSCVFDNCTIAASFQACSNTTVVHDNIASSSSVGLLLLASTNGSVTDSMFVNNGSNYCADVPSAASWTSDYNDMSGTPGAWGACPPISNAYGWWSATKQDRHSIYVAPIFISTTDLHPASRVSWGGGLPGRSVGLPSITTELDRDGRAFRVRDGGVSTGAYDYPDPVAGGGWTELDVAVPAGVRVSAGVYKAGPSKGSLIMVRKLVDDAAGVHTLWWDGRDDYRQVAPAGPYMTVVVGHDIRLVDDGAIANSGQPVGQSGLAAGEQVIGLDDGGFLATAAYTESTLDVLRFDAAGTSTYASAQLDADFWGLSKHGDLIIAGMDRGTDSKLVSLALPGERAPMANGSWWYSIVSPDEKTAKPAGVAVIGQKAYASLAGIDVIRVIDLSTGAKIARLATSRRRQHCNRSRWASVCTQRRRIDRHGRTGPTTASIPDWPFRS